MATKMVNGVSVDMTPDELAAFEAQRVFNLPQAKRYMRLRIMARRERAELGGFLNGSTRYDSDAQSLSRIAILASRARTGKALGSNIVVSMVAADDSMTNMNADALLSLELSSGDHFIACSNNARVLRLAVNQADTVAAALAVDTEAGWP